MIHSRSVLFLVSLFIWFFVFSSFSYSQQPKNLPPLPNPGKLPPPPGGPPLQAMPGGDSFAPQPPIKEEESDDEARNPFLLPDGVYLKSELVNDEKPAEPEGEPSLQAVTITKKNRIATINNFNFEVGDIAFGKKVVAISNDRVILENDAERITLTLKNRYFRIKVNKDEN
jgi:hypothetical protein